MILRKCCFDPGKIDKNSRNTTCIYFLASKHSVHGRSGAIPDCSWDVISSSQRSHLAFEWTFFLSALSRLFLAASSTKCARGSSQLLHCAVTKRARDRLRQILRQFNLNASTKTVSSCTSLLVTRTKFCITPKRVLSWRGLMAHCCACLRAT